MWDIFICHASEDKDEVVRPLGALLQRAGLTVFLDERTFNVHISVWRGEESHSEGPPEDPCASASVPGTHVSLKHECHHNLRPAHAHIDHAFNQRRNALA